MDSPVTIALTTIALLYVALSPAVAQNAPPSYQGDPDVYKVIFEDQNFRVIASTRKKGDMIRSTRTPFHQSPIFSLIAQLGYTHPTVKQPRTPRRPGRRGL